MTDGFCQMDSMINHEIHETHERNTKEFQPDKRGGYPFVSFRVFRGFQNQIARRSVCASSSGVSAIGFAFMLLAFAALATMSATCSSRMP